MTFDLVPTVRLLSVPSGPDSIVHDDQCPSVFAISEHTRLDRSVEVCRSICGESGGGSHGAYDDDGFTAVDGEVHYGAD